MSEKINLEEILKKHIIPIIHANNPDSTFNATIIAMKEACSQILELAAENSKIEIKSVGEELIITDVYQQDNYTRIQVNLKCYCLSLCLYYKYTYNIIKLYTIIRLFLSF